MQPLPPKDWRVYPRVCGETRMGAGIMGVQIGLSPRVRGNPNRLRVNPTMIRSIPACAGKPVTAGPPILQPRVYPRVCGETFTWTRQR